MTSCQIFKFIQLFYTQWLKNNYDPVDDRNLTLANVYDYARNIFVKLLSFSLCLSSVEVV